MLEPVLSEKALLLRKSGKYLFRASEPLTKKEIASSIRQRYGVEVVAVRTLTHPRRVRRTTRRPLLHLAIVTLPQGKKIKELELEAVASEKAAK